MDYIACIERAVGREAKKNFLPMQPGDVPETCADVDDLMRETGFRPSTPLEEGIARFVAWYREYHQVQVLQRVLAGKLIRLRRF